MEFDSAKRIAVFAAVFAGAATWGCPTLAVATAALGTATLKEFTGHFGKKLTGSIEKVIVPAKGVNPLTNHDLQKLVGRATALLIEFDGRENQEMPTGVDAWIPLLHRSDAEFSALAKAAVKYWDRLDLTGASERLQDHRIQEAFTHYDRIGADSYVSAEEWDKHLKTLAALAKTWYGEQVVFIDKDRRFPLAKFIAKHFAAAIRELVKADLDPNIGTGGRVFIALHLDIMRTMAVSLRSLETTSKQQLEELNAIKDGIAALRKEVADRLTDAQENEYGLLNEDVLQEIQATGKEFGTKLDAIATRLTEMERVGLNTLDAVAVGNEAIVVMSAQMTELLAAFKAATPASAESSAASAPRVNDDHALESAIVRIARDAERGVESAQRALADKSPAEAGDYFADKLARIDAARSAIVERMDAEEVQISREASEVLYRTGRISEAESSLRRILRHLPADLDAINLLGQIYQLRGDFTAAEEQFQRLAALSPTDIVQAVALSNFGNIARGRSEFDVAVGYYKRALAIYMRLNSLKGQALIHGSLGNIAFTRGQLEEAESFFKTAFAIYRDLGHLEGLAVSHSKLGKIEVSRGSLIAAERRYTDALLINRTLGRLQGLAENFGDLGTVARLSGDLDAAEVYYKKAIAMQQSLGTRAWEAQGLVRLGIIAQARGDFAQAENYYNSALIIDRALGRLEGQALTLRNLGIVGKLVGKTGLARRSWVESRDIYQRIGLTHLVLQLESCLDTLPAK